jgi:AraC-like DNA-binding protein
MAVFRHDRPALFHRWVDHHARTEWHDHAQHQLLYPSRGVLTVSTRTGTWLIPPQRAVWLPAEHPHTHHAHGATHMRSVLFTHEPHLPETASHRPLVLSVSPLLRELLRTLTDTSPPSASKEALLRRLVIEELVFEPVPFLHIAEPTDDRLRAIAATLHADPADPRSLFELGRAIGASARTLSRLCATQLGMSFPSWRGQIRLLHAALALTGGDSVTTVAHRNGYSSPSAFVAAFRQAFDTTPGAYQTQCQRAPTTLHQ